MRDQSTTSNNFSHSISTLPSLGYVRSKSLRCGHLLCTDFASVRGHHRFPSVVVVEDSRPTVPPLKCSMCVESPSMPQYFFPGKICVSSHSPSYRKLCLIVTAKQRIILPRRLHESRRIISIHLSYYKRNERAM